MWVVMIGSFEDSGSSLDSVGAYGPYNSFDEAASAVPKLFTDRFDDQDVLDDFEREWEPKQGKRGYGAWLEGGLVQISVEPLTKG